MSISSGEVLSSYYNCLEAELSALTEDQLQALVEIAQSLYELETISEIHALDWSLLSFAVQRAFLEGALFSTWQLAVVFPPSFRQ